MKPSTEIDEMYQRLDKLSETHVGDYHTDRFDKAMTQLNELFLELVNADQ